MTTKIETDANGNQHLILNGYSVSVIDDARMDDSGENYFTIASVIDEDGVERDLRVQWELLQSWQDAIDQYQKECDEWDKAGNPGSAPSNCNEFANLDDDSNACDWDDFVVIDEAGDEIASSQSE